jgi:hypothetical protein
MGRSATDYDSSVYCSRRPEAPPCSQRLAALSGREGMELAAAPCMPRAQHHAQVVTYIEINMPYLGFKISAP